ncbi:MAG: protein-methionine-sulfoxide reductase catalytic subunit MsrP [Xanthomonadales bacterium]|jgi:sulfoxide reductase catalytic subunit YedY|nr:protein-methionine-sulfoxide reductase catalytic subunit MsrP [Xanthomonadales bacterium]
MKCKNPIRSWEITSESNYLKRRDFIRGTALAAGGAALSTALPAAASPTGQKLETVPWPGSTDEKMNSWEDVTTYNNFYEFGTAKEDPYRNAQNFEPQPWTVEVGGECGKPGTYAYEDIVGPHTLEDRVYRHRCVEAWSMVVPWVGFPLGDLLKRFEPNSNAKYVAFRTLHDPERMPGQRRPVLRWPYREGLTIAEAMHPLTLMVVGVYGRVLPNQKGAPMRLVIPWKYGFKGIKSIVSIEFTERMPKTSWNMSAPHEYGFYANVNPEVDHPRWSQARERRIGAGLFAEKQPTLMFNGYGEEVAQLYAGLNLRRYF